MRTKTLLLSAAALAAGVATSMAANVYSVNVVGYINVTAAPGFNMIANQLDIDGVDSITTVLGTATDPATLDSCQVELFNKLTSSYSVDVYDNSGLSGPPGWYDGGGNASTAPIPPGKGMFFYNSKTTNITLTLVGTVLQGTNNVALTTGFNLIGDIEPVAAQLMPASNGFPVTDGMQFEAFTNIIGHPANYTGILLYDASGLSGPPDWYDGGGNVSRPQPAVSQGYFLYTPSNVTWSNIFTVQ